MTSARESDAGSTISELVIVDTLTRLIFGDESGFGEREQDIIRALRLVDPQVTPDDLVEMGEYLRALGVAEMIDLVARVRGCLAAGLPVVVPGGLDSGELSRPRS